jgi:hypothetical protein
LNRAQIIPLPLTCGQTALREREKDVDLLSRDGEPRSYSNDISRDQVLDLAPEVSCEIKLFHRQIKRFSTFEVVLYPYDQSYGEEIELNTTRLIS